MTGVRVRRAGGGAPLWLPESATLGAGGEGRVLAVDGTGLVAKLYHEPTPARAAKLAAMLARPPAGEAAAALCWPTDLLHDAASGAFVGYLMPRLPGVSPVFRLYNPGLRRRERPHVTWGDLHGVARQVAGAMGAAHTIDAVVGDINESNTVVDDALRVRLVDCDSFRIVDPRTGRVHRSPVAKAEFTAPELQGQSMAEVDQTLEDDLFGLAVLLFQLLLEGTHPYEGVLGGPGEPAPYGARIAAGWLPWVPGRGGPYRPKPLAVPVEVLHPALRSAFVRCFVDGHGRPEARPDAATWQRLLAVAEADLRPCAANERHRVPSHLRACPWCERRALLRGLDPFPSAEDVTAGRHVPPSAPPLARRAAPRPLAAPRAPLPARRRSPPRLTVGAPAHGGQPWGRGAASGRRLGLAIVAVGLLGGLLLGVQRGAPGVDKRPLDQAVHPNGPAAARKTPEPLEAELRRLLEVGDPEALQEAARLLVLSGRRDERGRTPLMIAADRGSLLGVERLLDAGADPNATDPDGFTALMVAANRGATPVVERLIGAGADVDARDDEDYTALHFAVMSRSQGAVRALLRAGAEAGARTAKGWTPLHSAAAKGGADLVADLLAAGAPVDVQDANACTALMGAADAGSPETVAALLRAGADPALETPCGSPRGYAERKGCGACLEALERAAP